jgi:RNA polymerase sigma-70 factor (ECF subfamily)
VSDTLAEPFERNRAHLKAVAYRMLGSMSEAEDAVQEAWLRLSRSDAAAIENLGGWLTSVTARVCLDMLRSRKARREAPEVTEAVASDRADPETELALASSVGLALLVVLDTLDPAERLAFVLHDLFAVPFDEIAGIVGRSPDATRQLASRARRRVQGTDRVPAADDGRRRAVIEAFLAAARGGDFDALLAVLDPDVLTRTHKASQRGAVVAAERAIKGGARSAQVGLVDGVVDVVIAPRGHLRMVLRFTISDAGKIQEIESLVGEQLAALTIAAI